jgi:hypothetical protein
MSALSREGDEMLTAIMDAVEGRDGTYEDMAEAAGALLIAALAKCSPEARERLLRLIDGGAVRRKVSSFRASGVVPPDPEARALN